MDKKEAIQKRLKELELAYQPGETALDAIAGVTLINIIGPSGVGKSSVNSMITKLDPQFSVPLGFTTRPARPSEELKKYRHIPDTAEGWQSILDKAQAGALVQYAIHTTSGMAYGTEPMDYETLFSVLDMQYQLVEKTHGLGFLAVKNVAIVTTPADYAQQLAKQERLINSAADMEKRRHEGILCLKWCLEHRDDINWIHNRYGELERTALEVIGLAKGNLKPNEENRRLGEKLLKTLERS